MILQTTIKNWSVHVTPSTTSAPTTPTPMSVGPVEMDPVEMDPMGLGPMVPNLLDFRPTTVTSQKTSLRKTYKTWKEVHPVSLNYSTQTG